MFTDWWKECKRQNCSSFFLFFPLPLPRFLGACGGTWIDFVSSHVLWANNIRHHQSVWLLESPIKWLRRTSSPVAVNLINSLFPVLVIQPMAMSTCYLSCSGLAKRKDKDVQKEFRLQKKNKKQTTNGYFWKTWMIYVKLEIQLSYWTGNPRTCSVAQLDKSDSQMCCDCEYP